MRAENLGLTPSFLVAKYSHSTLLAHRHIFTYVCTLYRPHNIFLHLKHITFTSCIVVLSYLFSYFSFFFPPFHMSVFSLFSMLCGPAVHKCFINNSVNNIKSIVFSKVVLINMNEFICLHQSMINAH